MPVKKTTKDGLERLTARLSTTVMRRREALGLSRYELAKLAGLHRTSIYLIENGSANVTLKSLDKLASALDVSLTDLLGTNDKAARVKSDKKIKAGRAVVRVLLIEDNPADIYLIKRSLKSTGLPIELEVVEDGAEALSLLSKQSGSADRSSFLPDLVILDLNIPKIDGRQLLVQMKADAKLRRIPVAIMTTSAQAKDTIESYDRHANCLITKPSSPEAFADAIRSTLEFWAKTARLPGRS